MERPFKTIGLTPAQVNNFFKAYGNRSDADSIYSTLLRYG